MRRFMAVLVFLGIIGPISSAPLLSAEGKSGYTSAFETSSVMDFFKALCGVDVVGGAGMGECYETNAKAVRQKYDLMHSRLISENYNLCKKQKEALVLSKKSYKTYTANMCQSVNFFGNTAGYVSEQYCILQLSIQDYNNLITFASQIERARSCETEK